MHTLFEGIVSRYKVLVDRLRYTAECIALSSGSDKSSTYKALTAPIANRLVSEVVDKITAMILETSTKEEGRSSMRKASLERKPSFSPAPSIAGSSSSASSSSGSAKLFDLQIDTSSTERTFRSARRR